MQTEGHRAGSSGGGQLQLPWGRRRQEGELASKESSGECRRLSLLPPLSPPPHQGHTVQLPGCVTLRVLVTPKGQEVSGQALGTAVATSSLEAEHPGLWGQAQPPIVLFSTNPSSVTSSGLQRSEAEGHTEAIGPGLAQVTQVTITVAPVCH